MSEDYEVGFGKPPKDTRFKKGQSGNPNGRPKKKRSAQELLESLMLEPMEIVLDGKKKKVSTLEATLLRLRNDALTGKPIDRVRALKQMKELCPDLDFTNTLETDPEVVVRIVDPDGLDQDLNLSRKERKLVRKIVEGLRTGDIDRHELMCAVNNDPFYDTD